MKGDLNLYGYCSNSPLVNADPDGKYEVRIGWYGVSGLANHSYVLVTDNVRGSKTFVWTWAYSFGPLNHNASLLTTYTAGPITDYSGLYNARQYDWHTRYGGNHGRYMLEQNQLGVQPLLNFLARTTSMMSTAGYPDYDLTGFNSNAMSMQMISAVDYCQNNIGVSGSSIYNSIEGRVRDFYSSYDTTLAKGLGRSFVGWNRISSK